MLNSSFSNILIIFTYSQSQSHVISRKEICWNEEKKKYVEMAKVVDQFRLIIVFSRITKFFMTY